MCKHVGFDDTISKLGNIDKTVEPVVDGNKNNSCKYDLKYYVPNVVKEGNKQRAEANVSSTSVNKTPPLVTNEMKMEKQQIKDIHKSPCSDGSFELQTHHQGRQEAMIGIITVHTVDV